MTGHVLVGGKSGAGAGGEVEFPVVVPVLSEAIILLTLGARPAVPVCVRNLEFRFYR